MYTLNLNLRQALDNLASDFIKVYNTINDLGLDLSLHKIIIIIFTSRRLPKNLSIHLLNHEFSVSVSVRYQGLIYNQKRNWQKHLCHIKNKVESKLNNLSFLQGANWGANQNISRLLFLNMIRPIIDFGLPIYCNNFSIMDQINKIQNKYIRKVLSIQSSTPTNNLNAEAAIPLIQFCLNYFTDKTLLKAMSFQHNSITDDFEANDDE